MAADRPRVFLDINIGTDPAGRLTFELFSDKAPRTCENFRALCTGSHPPLSYKRSSFHRVIDEFMIQGGDITKGDGTGGMSIYGGEFQDENLDWRELDSPGLLCMANRGKGTNSSQFFVTLAACPHLNGKHTIFGHIVSGQETLDTISKIPVDSNDRPTTDVIIMHSGELERKKKATPISSSSAERIRMLPHKRGSYTSYTSAASMDSQSSERGRGKRRRASHSHSRSRSRSRSRSPARHGKLRKQVHNLPKSRSRSRSSSPAQDKAAAAAIPKTRHRARRSSDHSVDETLRGRQRCRPDEQMRMSPAIEEDSDPSPAPRKEQYRARNSPPSRHRSPRGDSRSPGFRRRRSLPNHYERRRGDGSRDRDSPPKSSTEQDMEVDGASQGQSQTQSYENRSVGLDGAGDNPSWRKANDRHDRHERWQGHGRRDRKHKDRHATSGRLGHDSVYGDNDNDTSGAGIRFKGRGSMKYRERY